MTEVRRVHVSDRQRLIGKISRFFWWATSLLEGLIGLRVLLKLLAANPGNPFANFVYSISDVFLRPFLGLTTTPSAGGVVLEISSLIAMIVYLLGTVMLVELIRLLLSRRG